MSYCEQLALYLFGSLREFFTDCKYFNIRYNLRETETVWSKMADSGEDDTICPICSKGYRADGEHVPKI